MIPFLMIYLHALRLQMILSRSRGWESGGVASISPNAGDVIYGSVAELTPKEKAALDQYEGSYVFKTFVCAFF
eukprot:m.70085 g.70085  ORF g.70085 m.70085 type:complete len:73 (+) comp9995_c0_seq2:255-473(+)